MTDALPLPARLAGAVWGHLIGDAMGVPYEFRPPERVGKVRWGERGTYGRPPGTWSDDGALMLALLDSLFAVGFDPEDQGQRALAWRRDGAYTPDGVLFDIGRTTSEALRRFEAGTPAEEAGLTGEQSQSNGSLMRILPLALWAFARTLDDAALAAYAVRASRVTHRHPTCQVTCTLYVLTATQLLKGVQPAQALKLAISSAKGNLHEEGHGRALAELVAWPGTHHPDGRGGVLDAFWSAWRAFEGASNYRETIERAIAYGHGTDTTAAIAGGLAGIRWGIDGIPATWLARMRGRSIVKPLLDGLLEAHGWRTSRSHPSRVDWVNLDSVPGLRGAPGRLGMTFLPGKQYFSHWSKAGPTGWWRDLELDVAALRTQHRCDVFLLLVEDDELGLTRTTRLAPAIKRHKIELRRHPVVDMDVPTDRDGYRETLAQLIAAIRAGKSVVVACRGGLGRTGTAVACLLVDAGMEPTAAIKLTRASRPKTIERGRQVEFVAAWKPGDALARA